MAAPIGPSGPLPPNWYEYHDPRGVPYYHNPLLNITQWEHPAASPAASPPASTVSLEPQGAGGRGASPSSQGGPSAASTVDLSLGQTNGADRAQPQTSLGGRGSGAAQHGFLFLGADSLQRDGHGRKGDGAVNGGSSARLSGQILRDSVDFSSYAFSQGQRGDDATPLRGGVGASSSGSEEEARKKSFFFSFCGGCFERQVAHLNRLFDVTTADISLRLRLALMPWKGREAPDAAGAAPGAGDELGAQAGEMKGDARRDGLDGLASSSALGAFGSGAASSVFLDSPDAYGPFWGATTLVLLFFACSNLPVLLWPSTFAAAGISADVRLLTQAASFVYALLFLPPFLVWAGLLWYRHYASEESDSTAEAGTSAPFPAAGAPPQFEQLLCVHGYALAPLCVCACLLLFLELLPQHTSVIALRWMTAGIAGAGAALFLCVHLKALLASQPKPAKLAAHALLILSVFVLLFLLLRFSATSSSLPAAADAGQLTQGAGLSREEGGDSPFAAVGESQRAGARGGSADEEAEFRRASRPREKTLVASGAEESSDESDVHDGGRGRADDAFANVEKEEGETKAPETIQRDAEARAEEAREDASGRRGGEASRAREGKDAVSEPQEEPREAGVVGTEQRTDGDDAEDGMEAEEASTPRLRL
ncbi:Yip1 domain-containing protein [Besnoitia besnoiti]|uniref:Yip1 domain-containing protein n=1 Tax=Besnoitia besnoiti TaxID=94643 RepID=A0A2A9MQF7_BESBE|nr:Yip1 domain-containing protein [Besnoitia besnoiti]PFH38776.1 Yip1 domain-containing protein [Besnoitia besnoiti]